MTRYDGLQQVPDGLRSVVTIGTFDGVHRGHRQIIGSLIDKAAQLDAQSMIVTFHPHPQTVLRRGGTTVPILMTIDERAAELERLGLDALVVLEFTREMAATPWQRFCDMLIDRLGMVHMIVGHDHAFGKDRQGDVAALTAYGRERGYGVTQIPALELETETVSSTKIRRALGDGQVDLAEEYLGRPYRLSGRVVRGDGRGRSIGVPTANIDPQEPAKLVPANGVYCVQLQIDGAWHAGMANIGVRPTFTDGSQRSIEVHLFDFDRDIYEQFVTVEFRKFVRSEQTFESLEAFLAQLRRDEAVCRGTTARGE